MSREFKPKAKAKYYDNYLATQRGNEFLDKRTGDLIGERTFNARHINDVENLSPKGQLLRPNRDIEGRIEDFKACVYNPLKPERELFKSNSGEKLFNIYKKEVRKKVSKEEEAQALTLIKGHFDWLFDDEETKEIFINWMAHIVQNPGVLLRWMPLLIGTKGDGKSTLGAVLSKILGEKNAIPLDANVINSPFTDWANNSALGIIDEFSLNKGGNSNSMQSFKNYVANDRIQIVGKGTKAISVKNVTNYIGTSNNKSDAPTESNDRRFWIVRTKHLDIELNEGWALARDKHHNELYAFIEKDRGIDALAQALTNYKISNKFKEYRTAPPTEFKAELQEENKSETAEAILERLQDVGAETINRYYIKESRAFKFSLFGDHGFIQPSSGSFVFSLKGGTATVGALKELGFKNIGVSKGKKDRKAMYKIPEKYLEYFNQGTPPDHEPQAEEKPARSDEITTNIRLNEAIPASKDTPFKKPSDDYLGMNKENSNNSELQVELTKNNY